MSWALRVLGLAGQVEVMEGTHPGPGQWVEAYDPDAHNGRGFVDTTLDEEKALRFATAKEAWDFWRQRSTVLPTRPDGMPNRPLTALSVIVEEVV